MQETIGVVVVLCLMVQRGCSNAATYRVGESGGWSFNTDSWPNGKQFRAGDVLCKFLTYPREILIPYESKCKLCIYWTYGWLLAVRLAWWLLAVIDLVIILHVLNLGA